MHIYLASLVKIYVYLVSNVTFMRETSSLRPALQQGCGRQTPRASALFSWTNLLHISTSRSIRSRFLYLFGTCKRMPLLSGDFWLNNNICRKLPLRSYIVFASSEKVRRPRSDSPLHFDDIDGWMIAFVTCKSSLVPLLEGLCTSNPCRFEFKHIASSQVNIKC